MPIEQLQATPAHKRLRLYSAIAAITAGVVVLLGVTFIVTQNDVVTRIHEGFGFLFVVAAALAVLPAKAWGDQSRSPALFRHALILVGLGIVQLVLGLTGATEGAPGALLVAHMGLGLLILLVAMALWDTARRAPAAVVTNVDGSPRNEA